ncbi:hypothetical protein [Enterococcus gallinarum]|uniref:hypothetical protein n=1 Tax=Enterococcus gallinarum TaxID=1353 RepID=UPI0021AB7A86|nr:hypothetical protein [Enterococcus gallinarum]
MSRCETVGSQGERSTCVLFYEKLNLCGRINDLEKEGTLMPFDMTIAASEFKEKN